LLEIRFQEKQKQEQAAVQKPKQEREEEGPQVAGSQGN